MQIKNNTLNITKNGFLNWLTILAKLQQMMKTRQNLGHQSKELKRQNVFDFTEIKYTVNSMFKTQIGWIVSQKDKN